jgi:hypothetical protein
LGFSILSRVVAPHGASGCRLDAARRPPRAASRVAIGGGAQPPGRADRYRLDEGTIPARAGIP